MRRSTGLLAAMACVTLIGACGSTPPSVSPSGQPAASAGSIAPEVQPVPDEQLASAWRAEPLTAGNAQTALVSDACAAAARHTLGEPTADLPTAVVDVRGERLVTVLMSDDVLAIACLARLAPDGTATVDAVDRLAAATFEPLDGARITVTQIQRDDQPGGGRTIAYGRVGPDGATVKVGFDDKSTVDASVANGWWAAWWPGSRPVAAVASVDGTSVVTATVEAPPAIVESRLGAASWWLDPAKPKPAEGAMSLDALVMELACASGKAGPDRVDPPLVDLTETTVTVTMALRRQATAQDCQGNPPFPFAIELPEPVGARTLLDGGTVPPRDATKPAG